MLARKVACPKCQATLKSAKPVPAGVEVACPRCRTRFVTPGDPPSGSATALTPTPGILVSAHANGAISADPPLVASDARTDLKSVPTSRPRSQREVLLGPASPGSRTPAVILVCFALLLLLGMGGGLAYWCFFTGQPAEEKDEPQGELEIKRKRGSAPPLIPLTKEEQEKVNQAVARGVEFLKKKQQPEGGWDLRGHEHAMAALGGLSLLECGVAADDAAVQTAAAFVRRRAVAEAQTYTLSVFILFLDRLNDPQDKARIRELAARLIAGQQPQGGWTYGPNPHLPPKDQEHLLGLLKDLGSKRWSGFSKEHADRLKILPANLLVLPVLQDHDQRDNNSFQGGGDNSNTQFAVLALWAARRHAVPVDRTLGLVVRRFRATQKADGSWDYSPGGIASPLRLPTMTCSGLLALAVGYGISDEQKSPRDDAAIQKALKRLSQNIGQPINLKSPTPPNEMYYLWSLERVAVLYHLRKIGGKDWYPWGLANLLATQRNDGSWLGAGHGEAAPELATCFALLFLQRANLAKDLSDKLQEVLDAAAAPESPAAPGPSPRRSHPP